MRCLSRVHDDPILEPRAAAHWEASVSRSQRAIQARSSANYESSMAFHTVVVQSRAGVRAQPGWQAWVDWSVMVGTNEATWAALRDRCSDGVGSFRGACMLDTGTWRLFQGFRVVMADHCLVKRQELAGALRRDVVWHKTGNPNITYSTREYFRTYGRVNVMMRWRTRRPSTSRHACCEISMSNWVRRHGEDVKVDILTATCIRLWEEAYPFGLQSPDGEDHKEHELGERRPKHSMYRWP